MGTTIFSPYSPACVIQAGKCLYQIIQACKVSRLLSRWRNDLRVARYLPRSAALLLLLISLLLFLALVPSFFLVLILLTSVVLPVILSFLLFFVLCSHIFPFSSFFLYSFLAAGCIFRPVCSFQGYFMCNFTRVIFNDGTIPHASRW